MELILGDITVQVIEIKIMDIFDYEDSYELETDTYAKNYRTPHQVMMDLFEGVYNRNHKEYLKSIEWDTLWLRHETEEEKQARLDEIEERKRQVELETHPFRQWF
jgi:hypothetical protein